MKWQKSRKSRKLMELRKADLVNLTPNEKAYLAPYIFGEETTQYFLMEDGIKGSLEARNILYRASNMGDMVNGWAYNIQPWARDHLRNNPHLLEGFTPQHAEVQSVVITLNNRLQAKISPLLYSSKIALEHGRYV